VGVTVRKLELDKSVVANQQAFDPHDPSGPILIEGLTPKQLQDSSNSDIAYDLRVGREYRILTQRKTKVLGQADHFDLKPGQSALIETEEWLHLPTGAFGLVVSKVSRVQEGMSNISTKVDPGYHGHLIVTVTNNGRRPIVFKRLHPFCSITFLVVDPPARAYAKPGKAIDNAPKLHLWTQVNAALQRNSTAVLVGATLLSGVLGALLVELIR
jgi:deoxycytidine triphosphate deaminase